MTPDTFEADFASYNAFRARCGARKVTRAEFARTVQTHNKICAITPEERKAFWDTIDAAFEEEAPQA